MAPTRTRDQESERDQHFPVQSFSSDDQHIDEQPHTEYESSVSFRGTSVIAGFTYLHIAIFVIAGDNYSRGIAYTVGTLIFSCFVFQPTLQATWIIYALWIPKLNLTKQRVLTALDAIFCLIFFILATHTSIQVGTEAFNRSDGVKIDFGPIIREALVMLSLLILYLAFLGWFTLRCIVASNDFGDRKWLQQVFSTTLAFASILSLSSATLPAIVWLYMVTSGFIRLEDLLDFQSWLAIGFESWLPINITIIFGSILVSVLIELGIQYRARTYGVAIRSTYHSLVVCSTIACPYSHIAVFKVLTPPGLLFMIPIVVGCQAWLILWTCYDIICSLVGKGDQM